jgi:plastocyanin
MDLHLGLRGRRLVAVLLAAAVAAFGLGLAGSAQAGTSTRHWKVWVGNQSKNMAVQGMRFLPGQVWIDEGDSVTWVANAAEIHTVTFFKGGQKQTTVSPFDPTSAKQTTRMGGTTYDTGKYFNSGIITTGKGLAAFPDWQIFSRYTLTFPHAGNFTYYCLVHGVMMTGTIHVRPDGTAYPSTQQQYNKRATARAAALVKNGERLIASTRAKSTAHHVFAGAENSKVSVMRFLRGTVHIPVGTKVTFDDATVATPHTVTFGPEPPGPAVLGPSGDPTSYKGGALNSGIILPGQTFTVTFKKAGTFPYICALHDEMGMVGTVKVG